MIRQRCALLLLTLPTWLSALQPLLSTTATTPNQQQRLSAVRVFSSTCLFARRGGGGNNNRGRAPPEVKPTMNEEITAPQLRVVTPNPKGKDEALGIMSRQEALTRAQEMGGLDLILINEKSDPPVCKIVDYSKYRYMQTKKQKELKKNSKATEIKEVKMSYKIDVHDYGVRLKNALKFIQQGNRVKCTVMFRGREVQHDALGYELLDKLADDMQDSAMREGRPKREGRNLMMIVQPKPAILKAVNENRKREEKAKKQAKVERATAKREAQVAAAASATVAIEDDDQQGDVLNGLLKDLQDDDDDDEDDEPSLDELLGTDSVTDELFST